MTSELALGLPLPPNSTLKNTFKYFVLSGRNWYHILFRSYNYYEAICAKVCTKSFVQL